MRLLVLPLLLALAAVNISFAASPVNAEQDDGFNRWFIATAHAAGRDPNYRRIPLDTASQSKSFVDVTHRLYRGDITPDQFRAAVIAVYPGHDYELDFLIAHLPQGR